MISKGNLNGEEKKTDLTQKLRFCLMLQHMPLLIDMQIVF